MTVYVPPIDTRVLDTDVERRCYTMGYNASRSPRTWSLTESETAWLIRHGYQALNNEHHAYLDGWMDYASGREKFHSLTCRDQDGHEHC